MVQTKYLNATELYTLLGCVIIMQTNLTITITIEELEQLVTKCVNNCLNEQKQMFEAKEQEDELMTIQDAAEMLHLSVPTLYSKCSKNELPYKKRSKRLYFSKKELRDYLDKGSH